MERWKPENPEQEPFAQLNLPDGKEVYARRDNTHLYTHLGELALFDFIRVEVEPENVLIFNFVGGYKELVEYMVENDYPLNINQIEVEDSIEDAFYRAHGSVDDTIPDSWE